MTYLNPICADVGTRNCPCPLAETGDCLICSRLSGRGSCDCRWAGVCIYNEYIQNGSMVRTRREDRSTGILQRLWRGDDLLLLQLRTSRGFALEASRPGSFLFLKSPGASEMTNVPVSVMVADSEHGTIWVALKILSAKTKALAACEDFLEVRGVYRSGLLGKGLAGIQADGRQLGKKDLEAKCLQKSQLEGNDSDEKCPEGRPPEQKSLGEEKLRKKALGEAFAGEELKKTPPVEERIKEEDSNTEQSAGRLRKPDPRSADPVEKSQNSNIPTRKRWLILTKGVGFAPAVNLIRWAAGRIDIHVIADPEKVGEDVIREQFRAWQPENDPIHLEFQSLAKLLDRLEAASPCMPQPAAGFVSHRSADSEAQKSADPALRAAAIELAPAVPLQQPNLHQTNYDWIFLLTSDYYIKRLSAAMKIPPEKLVFCNNFHLCCGEGICGACGHVDAAGNLHRMCKCREFSAQDLLLPEL